MASAGNGICEKGQHARQPLSARGLNEDARPHRRRSCRVDQPGSAAATMVQPSSSSNIRTGGITGAAYVLPRATRRSYMRFAGFRGTPGSRYSGRLCARGPPPPLPPRASVDASVLPPAMAEPPPPPPPSRDMAARARAGPQSEAQSSSPIQGIDTLRDHILLKRDMK